ncbi:MAG: hypothetical protein ACTHZI_01460 [Luteimonas sp.]
MPSSPRPDQQPSGNRWRRWLIGLVVLGVLLATWAVALLWFTGQVADGVESSINLAPAVEETHHRAD